MCIRSVLLPMNDHSSEAYKLLEQPCTGRCSDTKVRNCHFIGIHVIANNSKNFARVDFLYMAPCMIKVAAKILVVVLFSELHFEIFPLFSSFHVHIN